MDPKNNFLNAQPSITTNDEAERAEDLSTTDDLLETGSSARSEKPKDKDTYVNQVNDAEEIEANDMGSDEEA